MSISLLEPNVSTTPGALVRKEGDTWRLEIPAGPGGKYRLAQLDDYRDQSRALFPHQPPLALELECRASGDSLPGTWGFGLWNDPFSLSLGLGGGSRRFPALPNTAWFFFASPPNYLSFRDDLPAQGALAAVFRSSPMPAVMLALGAPLLGLLVIPGLAPPGEGVIPAPCSAGSRDADTQPSRLAPLPVGLGSGPGSVLDRWTASGPDGGCAAPTPGIRLVDRQPVRRLAARGAAGIWFASQSPTSLDRGARAGTH